MAGYCHRVMGVDMRGRDSDSIRNFRTTERSYKTCDRLISMFVDSVKNVKSRWCSMKHGFTTADLISTSATFNAWHSAVRTEF
jgi:hypothetical protein